MIFDYPDFIQINNRLGVYPETPIDYASGKIITGVKNLREGLDPDVLAYWYKRVEDRSREVVPPHLKDKVHSTIARYIDAIMVRTFDHGDLKEGGTVRHAGNRGIHTHDALLDRPVFQESSGNTDRRDEQGASLVI